MILLCTDFGLAGPYLGQVRIVLARQAPAVPAIDLFADLPRFRPDLAAYLLPAYTAGAGPGDVVVAVVDPGVGGARAALALEADDRWFVGPDNGLFEVVCRRARQWRAWRLDDRAAGIAPSFHGRDVFAPAAARLAMGQRPTAAPIRPASFERWPDDLPAIVYVDVYGNAMTGLRADRLDPAAIVEVAGRRIRRARTFSDVPEGEPLWYANANGLAEIAVNGGSAAAGLGLAPGAPVTVHGGG